MNLAARLRANLGCQFTKGEGVVYTVCIIRDLLSLAENPRARFPNGVDWKTFWGIYPIGRMPSAVYVYPESLLSARIRRFSGPDKREYSRYISNESSNRESPDRG